ncbi:DUF6069 family protein [Paractinoplanes atraurantiacus]|uniref:Uncharacterized protein n=1 Tax=Paractinoplanes atraurantiacus TaxID=1036182 RepID=A0A285KPZ0_9ACTN|nr:DUF6069 family protein [Actinoplanes atraurantiacus]SNY73466.1 hypothetical protein SAMN05421748_14714 [Actinoplanes atraurantiacus]
MPRIVLLGVVAAVAVNLLVYAVGRAAGGTFRFTTSGEPAEVDAVTVAGFSAVPLLAGLTAVALLGPWAARTALVLGPLLALGTIPLMTLPADFDTVSTVALALCHLTLIPIVVIAVRLSLSAGR